MLEGLEVSEVFLSNLEYSKRIDSEYYQKQFLTYENLIKAKGGIELSKLSNFLIGPFGSAFTVDNYTKNTAYRYIRGKDVKPMKLLDDDNVYLPEKDYNRLIKYALKENDVLISVVGTLGNAAIITKKDLPAIFSCKSTVLRPDKINGAYLLVYINTKFGKNLLLRKERGAIQKGLNIDDLKTVLIYVASSKFQNIIESLFLDSLKKTETSKKSYTNAEEILLKELGFKDFEPSNEPVNIKSFKESFLTTGRLDAEYYQKKYEEVIEKVKSQDYDLLQNLVSIKKSIEPGSKYYSDEGIPFLRVADYNKFGLTEPDKKLSNEFVKANQELINNLKPKKETILFSKDGSVGTAYMLKKDADFITSGAILHLKVRDKTKVLPEYLTLVLNSKVVQMQAQRDAGGSIILHWRVSEIENVVVPLIDFDKQKEIAELVEQSFVLKKQSEELLETAKRAVEIAIEESEEKAIEYINSKSE